MSENLATAEDCRPLYELAVKIKDLAPWDWMEETDLFGVQNPDDGEVGFVSIMGMAGEHFAVGVYLGAGGLSAFWDLQDAGPFLSPQDLLEIPQIQASFENRADLEKRDRDIIKTLGLKFRGANAYPQFRSIHPGHLPWHVEVAEAAFLRHVLEQTLDVAPRVKANPRLLKPKGRDAYLVRTAQKEGSALAWSDTVMKIPPVESTPIQVEYEPATFEAVRQLPPGTYKLEVDFFMLPSPVGERGERPYFPYMLLLVEHARGLIIGQALLEPKPTLEAMWGRVPGALLEQLKAVDARPAEIRIATGELYDVLKPLEKLLDVRLKLVNELPQLDEAVTSLMNFGGLWR